MSPEDAQAIVEALDGIRVALTRMLGLIVCGLALIALKVKR